MSNYCKTCKFFDPSQGFEGTSTGACMRLGANQNIVSDARAEQFITFLKDGNPQHVTVGENFGCILHRKEGQVG